jgi:hypothetical protein
VKKYLTAIAIIVALLTSAAAYTQTVHLQTTVPFKFNVGSKQFPAGKYDIQTEPNREHVLYIRNMNSGEGTFVVPQSCESAHFSSQTTLTFHRYGQQYFMAELWVAGYKQGHQFRVSRREAELAKELSKQETTLLVSRK